MAGLCLWKEVIFLPMSNDFKNEFLPISSKNSLHYKKIARVARGKSPELVALEGFRLCETALEAGFRPRAIVYSSELLNEIQTRRFSQWREWLDGTFKASPIRLDLSADLMKRLCSTVRPQGVFILVDRPRADFNSRTPLERGLLILENVQDPGNMGALIRVADAFGLDGVFCTSDAADPWQDKAVRASMGSVFHIDIFRGESILDICDILTARQIPVLAAALDGENLRQIKLVGPAAVVFGNEGSGLSRQALDAVDRKITIEMPGRAESLNVAVAAGICCFHLFT